jgi:hypothetical protein
MLAYSCEINGTGVIDPKKKVSYGFNNIYLVTLHVSLVHGPSSEANK